MVSSGPPPSRAHLTSTSARAHLTSTSARAHLTIDASPGLLWADWMGGKVKERLTDKVVWITGASSGIGEQLSYELSRVNAKLILSARRVEALERVRNKCLDKGGGKMRESDVMVLPLDVTREQDIKPAIEEALRHFPHIDVAVCNAGRTFQLSPFADVEEQADREIFDLNTFATISHARAATKLFQAQGFGHLVLMSSVVSLFNTPTWASYTASKRAMDTYIDCLRLENDLVSSNIKITQLYPGFTLTEVLDNMVCSNQHSKDKKQQKKTKQKMKEQPPAPEIPWYMHTAERVAHLTTLAIARQMPHAAICYLPFLAYCYLPQKLVWPVRKMLISRSKVYKSFTVGPVLDEATERKPTPA